MKFIKLNTNQYCLRLERGEEILNSVTSFCKKQKIFSGYFHGIGATDDLMINFFDEKNKKYNSLNFKGPWEITSLMGNISLLEKQPFLHAHINVSDASCNVKGGHLKSAIISVTCEIFITKCNKKLVRQYDKQVGINLLKF